MPSTRRKWLTGVATALGGLTGCSMDAFPVKTPQRGQASNQPEAKLRGDKLREPTGENPGDTAPVAQFQETPQKTGRGVPASVSRECMFGEAFERASRARDR